MHKEVPLKCYGAAEYDELVWTREKPIAGFHQLN
jgi:hypothetical protein